MKRAIVWSLVALFLLDLVCFFDYFYGGLSQFSFRLNALVFGIIALSGLVMYRRTPKPALMMFIIVILVLGCAASAAAVVGGFRFTATVSNLVISFGLLVCATRAWANGHPPRT